MSGISLDDRIAVHELIAEYSFRVDNYRGEEWADLFLEDGRLVGPGILLEGHQGFIQQSMDLQAGPTEYRHVISNVFLEEGSSDERVIANAYGTVCDWAQSPPLLSIFVEYRFELHKVGERWKIAEMRVHMPYDS